MYSVILFFQNQHHTQFPIYPVCHDCLANVTVPAATYTRNPATGAWTVVPGVSTLVVTGTV